MDTQQNTSQPPRYLSVLDVCAMAFGCMVGWGTFVMPGTTFLPVAGPAGTVIAMVIGICIMLVIGCNLAFFMNRSTRAGGVYSYTKEAFGRDHAFLSSWFLCLSYLTIVFLNGTALFIVMRTLFGVCVPLFIMLSGYLMSKKTVSRSYYKGIRTVLDLSVYYILLLLHIIFGHHGYERQIGILLRAHKTRSLPHILPSLGIITVNYHRYMLPFFVLTRSKIAL